MSIRNITVAASGVTCITSDTIFVNDENLVRQIDRAIGCVHPKTDANNQFAARVIITVELLGDLEEEA